jgi:hypothetical protein
MKAWKNRLLQIFLTIALLLTSTIASVGANEPPEPSKQQNAPLEHSIFQFVDEFRKTYSEDEYAGMYFNEDGDLVVNLIDNTKKSDIIAHIENEKERIAKSEDELIKFKDKIIQIKTVKYSLGELNRTVSSLSDQLIGWNLQSVALDEEKNCVIIGANTSISVSEIHKRIKGIVKNDMIIIEQNDLEVVTTAKVTVTPGTALNAGGGTFTVAWGATYKV